MGGSRRATELSEMPPRARPGSATLQRVLADRYGARAQVLKARSALAALRAIGDELERRGIARRADLVAGRRPARGVVGRLALLRLQHLVLTGLIDADRRGARRDRPPVWLGLAAETGSGCDRRHGRRRARRGARRHRALAVARRQPAQRPSDDRGGRDRQPRLRGDPRRRAGRPSAVRGVELARVGREAEPLDAGEDAAMTELGHRPLGCGLAGQQSREQQVGGGRLRVRPAGRQAEDRPYRRPGRARASSPDGPARRDGPPDRRAPRSPGRTGRAGSVLADPAVSTRSAVSAPRVNRATRRLDRVGVVLDVGDREDRRAEPLDLGADARLEPLAGGARGPISLTTTPTRRRWNGATHTIGWPPKPAIRAAASTTDASTMWGATLTLATSSPRSTTCPSKTVNTSSGSSRLIRSRSPTWTLTTPSAAATRSSRLSLGPRTSRSGPAIARARRSAASSSWSSPGSMTRTVTGGAGVRGRDARAGRRTPADGPLPSAARRSAGRGPGSAPASDAGARRPGVTRSTRTRGRWAGRAASGRARPRSRGGCRPPPSRAR